MRTKFTVDGLRGLVVVGDHLQLDAHLVTKLL